MALQISAEAKIRYVERRRKDISDCLQAISNLDYKFLQNVGHQLKGSAITFGHPKLGELGETLELKAFDKDMGAIKILIQEFEDYLKTIVNESIS